MASEYCYTQRYRNLRTSVIAVLKDINSPKKIASTSGGGSVDLLDGWVFKQYPNNSYFSFVTIPFNDGEFATNFRLSKERIDAIVNARCANYVYNTKKSSWVWHPEDSLEYILKLLEGGIEEAPREDLKGWIPAVNQDLVGVYKYKYSHHLIS